MSALDDPVLRRFGGAVLFTATAALALAMMPDLSYGPSMLILLIPVWLSAALLGPGPGVLSLVLAGALALMMQPDLRALLQLGLIDGPAELGSFALAGGAACAVSEAFHRERQRNRARICGATESQQRLNAAFTAAKMIAWDWDVDQRRVRLSGDAARLSPVTDGRPEDFYRMVHPADRESLERELARMLAGQAPAEMEFRVVRPDGEIRWYRTRGYPMRDAAGRVRRVVGISEDITEIRQAREALELEKKNAEEANRAKDQFLASLSHELRTPLTPALALLSILASDQRLPEDVRQELGTVRQNIEVQSRLIDDMLDLTRIGRGKMEMKPSSTDLKQVVEHAMQICCAQDINTGRILVVRELNAGEHHVWGDPARLLQVFWNILNNAMKFTPAGGTVTVRSWNEGVAFPPEARAGVVPCPQAGGRIVVEIRDTGAGIDPRVLPRLFRPFEQGQREVTRQFGGLGLGLSISRAIVCAHGGQIEAFSEGAGRGAAFRVHLPLCPPVQTPATAAQASGVEQPLRPARGLKLLLVEDHVDTARVIGRLLRADGHEVVVAGDIASAMQAASEADFDLIISDLGLPDGSGLDLMRRLRQLHRGMRGIALSGYGMEEDVRRSIDAGFAEHLIKPIEFTNLESAIARLAPA